MGRLRTVRELAEAAYRASAGAATAPVDFIRRWREENPLYGKWSLVTRFAPGARMPIRPDDFAHDADEIATTPTQALRAKLDTERDMLRWMVECNGAGGSDRTEFSPDAIACQRAIVAELEAELNSRADADSPTT